MCGDTYYQRARRIPRCDAVAHIEENPAGKGRQPPQVRCDSPSCAYQLSKAAGIEKAGRSRSNDARSRIADISRCKRPRRHARGGGGAPARRNPKRCWASLASAAQPCRKQFRAESVPWDGQPRQLSLAQLLQHFLAYREPRSFAAPALAQAAP